VAAIESVTNPRLEAQLGKVTHVPRKDWIFGSGASPVMAAFCHPNPSGSRFSDGRFGIYYAASSTEAAASEVAFHRTRLYRDNGIEPRTDTFRCYVGSVVRPLVDIRAEPKPRRLHDPDSWHWSRPFGGRCRDDGEWGIHYRSVRAEDAECVALLRPPASSPVIQGAHVEMHWTGSEVVPKLGA
ncbi:MAG: RES family NAD+ phosphorylase, partial [Wenzhouxiangellaceae bacterium]|nr:RES family NAD+ phosphorylase [Wenzhouxiangellaceae bacterium]